MNFKQFLLNENVAFFNQRVGDILNALQDLNQDSKQMGTRFLISNSEKIVNQMRSLLHQNWSKTKQKDIKTIQKCAIALMKGIEEKSDLQQIINKCVQNLQTIGTETPVNQIASPTGQEVPKEIPKNVGKGVSEPIMPQPQAMPNQVANNQTASNQLNQPNPNQPQ
jgi:hypothetical protein